jgi:hypothetical protein
MSDVLAEYADLVASRGDHETAYRLTREALRPTVAS